MLSSEGSYCVSKHSVWDIGFLKLKSRINNKHVNNIIHVRYNGCVNEIISKADTFLVNFPGGATFVDKVLILAAAIIIDFD